MLRNYLTTAIRNLVKNRLYSVINIGGLAVGLAACLLILLYVRDELSYDRWLPNAERIANLEVTFRAPGREPLSFAQSPGPVKPLLESDFTSDVERSVRLYWSNEPIRIGDRIFAETVTYVDPGFFQVFDLPMVEGDREAALVNNTSLIVSQKMAEKLFGDQPAVGKVLTVNSKTDYTVVGVFADLPTNSHLEFDLIGLFDTQRYVDSPGIAENWTSANVNTYTLFRSVEAMERVQAAMPAFIERNMVLNVPGFEKAKKADLVQFELRPVPDIHLHGKLPGYVKPSGDIVNVVAFSAIAGLILLIACINFVNLATARSMKRAREVAMRKVVGATRSQLVVQHLGEAVLTATVALVLAIALVELALGPYNSFLQKELALDFIADPILALVAAGLVAVVGVLGGLYPAIYLSRFRPAHVLKANQSAASGSPRFRNALVVFQFAISIALIVCTATVYLQTIYARRIDLGYDTGHRLVLEGLGDMASVEMQTTLRKEVAALPGVRSASLSSDTPPLESNNNSLIHRRPVIGNDGMLIETLEVDFDFFATYGVKPLAGRVFSRQYATDVRVTPEDPSKEITQAIVVNRTFLSKLGVSDPAKAVGMTVWDIVDLGRTDMPERMARTTIVGVVPDMHLRSLRSPITPMLYYVLPDGRDFGSLSVHVEPGRAREVYERVAAVWQRLVPGVPIRTQYVDEKIVALYDAEEQRAQTFAAFAVFAVLIACLGLFGLASFAAERRTKEIGLRKVMGANVFDIVRLLVWQFSKPVLVANFIAWPVAFYFMNRWLSGFHYAIDLTSPLVLLGVFGGAGLVALAIAWSTVAGHATRVGRSNPIYALRCE